MNNVIKIYNIYSIAKNIEENDADQLTYRQHGRKIYEQLRRQIFNNCKDCYAILDFSNIKICDVSCADEIVLQLIVDIIKEKKHIVVILSNLNEQVFENIEAAQLYRELKMSKQLEEKVSLPLHFKAEDEIILLGNIEMNLRETYNLLCERGAITARELSDIKGIAINSASNRLKKLYDYSIIQRETKMNENGQYFIYSLNIN